MYGAIESQFQIQGKTIKKFSHKWSSELVSNLSLIRLAIESGKWQGAGPLFGTLDQTVL